LRAATVEAQQRNYLQYKQSKGHPFPTWIEVLDVLRGLGYEKNAERTLTIAQLES
jgi:hypothetical protein